MDFQKAPDEVVYAPPVPVADREQREQILTTWRAQGARIVDHVLAGDSIAGPSDGLVVWDPTAHLVGGQVHKLPDPPLSAWVVWPLIAGVSDGAALAQFVARESVAEVSGVLPVVAHLSASVKRKLVDQYGPAVFEALHHSASPEVAAAVKVVDQEGIRFQPPRPRHASESELHARACTVLSWLGDLLLRLDEEERGQRFLRAARWLERSPWDLSVLVRDGHLAVVPELNGEAGQVLEELAASGDPSLLTTIRRQYLDGVVTPE